MTKSTVIVPVFNQAALTKQCLETILGREDCQVIVVNDASTDETAKILADFGDRFTVLTHRTNAGFAKSCNDGAARARTPYLVFLNNDTIPQSGWLDGLVRYAETHPESAVVGAKLLYPVNTIQHAGVVICQDRYPRHIYSGFPADHPAVNKSRRFQIVTAACMLVRRTVFERAGGFDTAFRNGFEDVDFCLRLGKCGDEIHYCADSVVQHLESVSPGRFKLDKNNVALYRSRWLPRVQPDDLRYYTEDGLLNLSYEGRYPIGLQVSPLLACLDDAKRSGEMERRLQERSREVADLQRENTRLSLELGTRPGDSPELNYRQLRQHIRDAVQRMVPAGATVLVISKGDGSLLDFPHCRGWHFPQNERCTYAGYYPASSLEAIAHLEQLHSQGASHLLIPATSRWWLDHYAEFRHHLETHYTRLAGSDDPCLIYGLSQSDLPVFKNARTKDTERQRHCSASREG